MKKINKSISIHLHTELSSFCMKWNRASRIDTDQETIALGSYYVLSHISYAASQSPAADGATKARWKRDRTVCRRLSLHPNPSSLLISINSRHTQHKLPPLISHTHTHTHTSCYRKSNRKSESVLEMIWTLLVFSDSRLMFTCVYWRKRAKTR